MARPSRRIKNTNRPGSASKSRGSRRKLIEPASSEAIKAAEQVAMSAFSSGLRLAAAFGTAAAKTASLALASLATGADRFSDLVKKEALQSKGPQKRTEGKRKSVGRRRTKRR